VDIEKYFSRLDRVDAVIKILLAALAFTGVFLLTNTFYRKAALDVSFDYRFVEVGFSGSLFQSFYSANNYSFLGNLSAFVESPLFYVGDTMGVVKSLATLNSTPWADTMMYKQDEDWLLTIVDSIGPRFELGLPIFTKDHIGRPTQLYIPQLGSMLPSIKSKMSLHDYVVFLRAMLYSKVYGNRCFVSNTGSVAAKNVKVYFYGYEKGYAKGEILGAVSFDPSSQLERYDRFAIMNIPYIAPSATMPVWVYSTVGNLNKNHVRITFDDDREVNVMLYVFTFLGLFVVLLCLPLVHSPLSKIRARRARPN